MNKLCPYCSQEMELGCVQSRDGVQWRPKAVLVPALPSLSPKSVTLSDDLGVAPAYNCQACGIVLMAHRFK